MLVVGDIGLPGLVVMFLAPDPFMPDWASWIWPIGEITPAMRAAGFEEDKAIVALNSILRLADA